MKRVICSAALSMALLVTSPERANAVTPAQIYQFYEIADWWINEGGPQISRAIGMYNAFEAAEPSYRFFVSNQTGENFKFYFESEHCDKQPITIPSGQEGDVGCDTNEGDRIFNIFYGKTSFSVKKGDLMVIQYMDDGSVEMVDYTDQALGEARRRGIVP